ncbi:ribonuclease P protein subunit p29 [Annulohypoxylon maeteangense]|uniref:ribonuclease P protein subunit p29 n=1 Tax=Annulohypoxylon maeteangense TaxID=1927788 RepID=UPI002007EB59|nr:ribonuclease P protein subunit p29 [Annulohypoxylon maeteangense]KAI0889516.1 ribonuclease P protein subunit p29 [Annulohypoxylon maeteangense]
MATNNTNTLTHELLSRAHSPDSTNRIFTEKIQHRPLFLKPTSPPPSSNARDARRGARAEKRQRAKALKPKPLSARQRRKLRLYDVPKDSQKYAVFEPLNQLWLGYIREILGNELYSGGQGAAAKLSAADFHGAEVEVSRSGCPSRVGIRGIVIKDARFAFEIVTRKNQIKTVPKEGTMFCVNVPPAHDRSQEDTTAHNRRPFTFEIHGDQFQHRSADRATKKFKPHYLKDL